jgi:drug/metabolite transporter (DMT)-like permease
MATRSDYLKLHFIVFLWGFSAILGKLVTIPALEMVFYRAILAAAGMAVVILVTRGSFVVTRLQLIRLLLIGVIVTVHWLAFFGSARISNVSVSLVGFATNSLWAALLEPWFNQNRIKKFELLLGLTVLGGLYIIFSFDFEYAGGLFLGIVAGFTSALFSVFNARMVRRVSPFAITFYEMTGIFITLGILMLVYTIFDPAHQFQLLPTAHDWIYIALLAGVCSVYAYSVAVELMKKVSVFLIQLTLNLEPLYGIIMAVIIFGQNEKMGVNFYIGTAIILSSVASYPFLKKRFDKPSENSFNPESLPK